MLATPMQVKRQNLNSPYAALLEGTVTFKKDNYLLWCFSLMLVNRT